MIGFTLYEGYEEFLPFRQIFDASMFLGAIRHCSVNSTMTLHLSTQVLMKDNLQVSSKILLSPLQYCLTHLLKRFTIFAPKALNLPLHLNLIWISPLLQIFSLKEHGASF